MTKDVIALTPTMPDVWALLTSLYAGGSDLDVSAAADGAVVQLHGPGGRPLVSVESPLLVQVPGEAERLLGLTARTPYWWTEARASTAVPEAEKLAGVVCGRLNALLGGTTWPEGAASTKAVDITAVPSAGAGQPAVDVVTDKAAVVLIDRPVIALTSWLAEIMRTAVASRHALQIVTPPHVRLSAPARTTLARVPNRWVVQDPDCGYYDGLSGAVLRWQDGAFSPALSTEGRATVAEAFTRTPDSAVGRQLVVAFRTVHKADDGLLLGGALESVWEALTGSAPGGWGTAEPVNLPWSPRQLTDLARARVPEPSQLIVVGRPERPALATVRITRTTAGVEEDVVLTVGYGPDEELPLDLVRPLAEALVTGHSLKTMLVSVRRARQDLTAAPRLEGPPIPYAFTLGPEDVHAIGVDHARRPPVEVRPVSLGAAARPALHFPLGEAEDVAAWGRLQQLTAHLKGDRSQPSTGVRRG
ncbi:uncharacterized protein SGFS_074780 [Streptomyces graminofaciens]|uniref:Uncharacterized protein n=1 Tax=Streptomyces graminofaciens TaxID=68212 RepID=A0ABN5VRS3_9ACTN|nr:DUF6177 family protein [Streptomyces graminofaciens]BBC36184.1 uncharacterized protein SGFS_074780 [Streptomyces graminofaciens]